MNQWAQKSTARAPGNSGSLVALLARVAGDRKDSVGGTPVRPASSWSLSTLSASECLPRRHGGQLPNYFPLAGLCALVHWWGMSLYRATTYPQIGEQPEACVVAWRWLQQWAIFAIYDCDVLYDNEQNSLVKIICAGISASPQSRPFPCLPINTRLVSLWQRKSSGHARVGADRSLAHRCRLAGRPPTRLYHTGARWWPTSPPAHSHYGDHGVGVGRRRQAKGPMPRERGEGEGGPRPLSHIIFPSNNFLK